MGASWQLLIICIMILEKAPQARARLGPGRAGPGRPGLVPSGLARPVAIMRSRRDSLGQTLTGRVIEPPLGQVTSGGAFLHFATRLEVPAQGS